MSDATIGYGSKFSIDPAGGTSFTELAEVTNISPPSDQIDIVETTHMQSPNRTKEYTVGLRDPGVCSVEMNFVPGSATDDLLQSVRDAGTEVSCKIEFGNAATWTFSGLLTGYTPTLPLDDRMTVTAEFKVTSSYVAA